MNCNACGSLVVDQIYKSYTKRSLTSLCTFHDGGTDVYFCAGCTHIQSAPLANADAYYDTSYDILVGSAEEDQIYEINEGQKIFRTEHQVETLKQKINLQVSLKILDYGCAKSSTMYALKQQFPSIGVYLFDISDRYMPFWERFVEPGHWATYSIPSRWQQKFDVVTSFFSLEHMTDPQTALQNIHGVLKEGGVFYGVVPNVFTNMADMIVVDHVNHFTADSLAALLHLNGFKQIDVDETSHRGALVFTAVKSPAALANDFSLDDSCVFSVRTAALKVSAYWESVGAAIKKFEETINEFDQFAIYGAGFYGAFIASNLRYPERAVCVLDQNPFLQGRDVNGVPVLSPSELPARVKKVLVGLNPAVAKNVIAEVQALHSRDLEYFYL